MENCKLIGASLDVTLQNLKFQNQNSEGEYSLVLFNSTNNFKYKHYKNKPLMTMLISQVLLFPATSVAVYRTSVSPLGKRSPGEWVLVIIKADPEIVRNKEGNRGNFISNILQSYRLRIYNMEPQIMVLSLKYLEYSLQTM